MRGGEQGPDPEEQHGSERPQAEQCHGGDVAVKRDVLAAYDVESENGVCSKACQVADNGIFTLVHQGLIHSGGKFSKN